MRIIAGTRQPTAGKAVLGHNVVCGYLSQEFAETIPPDLTVYRNAKNAIPPGMNEKNFRNQLGAFGFDENDVEKPSGVLSGGEKIRLAFLRLFLQCPNFLLLDEPTTHLDLDGRALLQDALQKYKGTILLVSHDIDFVRRSCDRVCTRAASSSAVSAGNGARREKSAIRAALRSPCRSFPAR